MESDERLMMEDRISVTVESSRNGAIDLVRVLACYAVLSMHFGDGGIGRRLAVPSFMFLSFYLSGSRLMNGDWQYLKHRLLRLFLPYSFWGAMGFFLGNLMGGEYSTGDLLMQICTGYPTAAHLYYVTLVMIFTVVVFLVGKVWRTWSDYIFLILFLMSFVLQYTGWNYDMFNVIPGIVKHTPGRIVELLPLAIAGIWFAKAEGSCKNHMLPCVVVTLIVFVVALIMFYAKIPIMPRGFGCGGLQPTIMSITLCGAMILMGKIFGDAKMFSHVICSVGAMTSGIYFMHVIVGDALIYMGWQKSVLMPFILFMICYALTLVLMQHKYTRWMVR